VSVGGILVRITSEIGWLESVIVHPPGAEVGFMSPQTAQAALYDDIIHPARANTEHSQLVAALRQFATVHFLTDLLRETLSIHIARSAIVQRLCLGFGVPRLIPTLMELPTETLAQQLMQGTRHQTDSLSATLDSTGFAIPPMYNVYFTRDTAMCVGERVIVAAMTNRSRWGETVVMREIFNHHPALKGAGFWFDGSAPPSFAVTVEGGDVHVLREDAVAIGCGERTSPAGIEMLVGRFAEEGTIRHVIVQPIPIKRAYIHFDMVFTQLDHNLCMVHEPVMRGAERADTWLYTLSPGKAPKLTRHADFFTLLGELGIPMDVVPTGGSDPIQQAREQWQKGTNFFTIAPGKVIGYARNEATYQALETHGFRVVAGQDVVEGKVDLTTNGRIAIAIDGAELSRGGGGCRCMTLPVRRREP
jgi:arginine deiminase